MKDEQWIVPSCFVVTLIIVAIMWFFMEDSPATDLDFVRLREVTGSLDPNTTFGDSWSLRDAVRQNQADIRVLKEQYGY